MTFPRVTIIALLALFLPAALNAKVVFTGYGDLRLNAHSGFRIVGTPAVRAAFGGVDEARHHSRGFTLDNLGIFATTNIKEGMDFKVDFTYRQIAQAVREIRIQYAYLEHSPFPDFTYRLGKITLPFGYYNENRFYSFQRVELQSPVFQTGILGLPIASVGAALQKRVPTRVARWDFDVYAVNGYGGIPASPNAFRSPTLPNALGLTNNLGATDNNANVAAGGRITAAELGGGKAQAGISYYGGAWDPSGSKYFQMFNAHWHSTLGPVDLLLEGLHLDVAGDTGFAAAVGDTHWKTDGYFMNANFGRWRWRDMPLTPYLAAEGYVSRGHKDGGLKERLQAYSGGLNLKPHEALTLKAEYRYLWYGLPLANVGELSLWAHQVVVALTVTF